MPEHGEGDTAMHPLQVANSDPGFAYRFLHTDYTGTPGDIRWTNSGSCASLALHKLHEDNHSHPWLVRNHLQQGRQVSHG